MRRDPLPLRLFLLVFLGYAAYFLLTMLRPSYYLTGDEVYYLLTAASLWQDADLDLADEFADESYRAFYPQPITADEIDWHSLPGQGGELYSKHGVGLPLLLLPGWALGRQVGASLWLVALAAVLAVQLHGLMRDLVPGRGAIWLAWAGIALSPPLTLYAPLLFAELPAALALTLALRYGLLRPEGHGRWLALAALLFLPWLNPRYALLALPLILALWLRGRRWIAGVAAGGLVLPYLHNWVMLGRLPALGDYGRVGLDVLPAGLPGLWLDREVGLLPYAPIYLLALYGALRRRPNWPVWNWLWLPYLLFLGSYDHWFGGWNPPARMMVPLLPYLAPLAALALAEMAPPARRVTGWIAATIGAATSLLFLLNPLLRYNHLTGRSHLFGWLAARFGLDLNTIWPSLIAPTAITWLQTGVLAAAAAAGHWLLYRRRPPAGEMRP